MRPACRAKRDAFQHPEAGAQMEIRVLHGLAASFSEVRMLNSAFRLASAWLVLAMGTVAAPLQADDLNDYPTSARADYVFGCMKANGETQRSLDQCSCSIDIIASIVPYDRYITAETVLRMAQVRGNLGGEFRSTEQARAALDDLRRAQAEAEVRCF
jgi:hypothetical protein